jgi:23S rRNA pseudouridine955/2504/2580 synthase
VKAHKFDLRKATLFENGDYILINKPPFVSTLEDRNDPVNILAEVRKLIPEAQVCHRLDKDTSGVLAIAKNPFAYRHLSIQFENRQVSKVYHAIVDGIQRLENKFVDLPIEKQNDGKVSISRSGKAAQTTFNTLKTFKNHTLVECRPITGRMHQIRVHLSFIGAPITGDQLYGGKPFFLSSIKRDFKLKKLSEEEPIMKRMALHAFSVEFELLSGEKITIEAPYPKDFQALMRQLEENK